MFTLTYSEADIIGSEMIVLTKNKVTWLISTQSVKSDINDEGKETTLTSEDPRILEPMIVKYERWKQFFQHAAKTLDENKDNLTYNRITGHKQFKIHDGDFEYEFDLTCTECPSYCSDMVYEIKRMLRNFMESMS